MTQEQKELLLKDLCSRLPYGVKAVLKQTNCHDSTNHKVNEKDIYSFRTGKPLEEDYGQHDYYKVVVTDIKPYLFPLSSMTEEQKKEYNDVITPSIIASLEIEDAEYEETFPSLISIKDNVDSIDWFNKNNIDYRGLIPMGLAINAVGLNIY